MSASKATSVITLIALGALFAHAGPIPADNQRAIKAKNLDARLLLMRSMQSARMVNVIAIITKQGENDRVRQRLKLEQHAMGPQFRTVLQPLSIQGMTFLDDGQKSMVYLPDQQMAFECERVADFAEDIAERMALAEENYNIRLDTSQSVAGRPTFRVVASPKAPGLPARQFYLDQETLYPLRFTMASGGGKWKVAMDTQVVEFPRDMPQRHYRIDPVGAARKMKIEAGKPLNSVRNASDRLGFNPVVPKRLPLGFEIQQSELRQNEDGAQAVLWLSDGLATARIYQYRCPQMREGIWSLGNNTVLTEDGVTMMMVSDLPASVRRALLSAFAHREPRPIAAPSFSSTATLGVRGVPVPTEEPNRPRPMFSTPEPSPGVWSDSPVPAKAPSATPSDEWQSDKEI
jgi:hypothetical protein